MRTQFMDMHSWGSLKEKQQYIYIEAPQEEAELIFYNRFWHNPNRVSCTCCGNDYSISESETLEQASAYERWCRYDNKSNKYVDEKDPKWYRDYISLDIYKWFKSIIIIYEKDIKPEERVWTLPEQGYVYID